jgi:hypothetical protein
MCNPYSITTNQAAISGLFRVMNRYVGNLPPMPGRALTTKHPDDDMMRTYPGGHLKMTVLALGLDSNLKPSCFSSEFPGQGNLPHGHRHALRFDIDVAIRRGLYRGDQDLPGGMVFR